MGCHRGPILCALLALIMGASACTFSPQNRVPNEPRHSLCERSDIEPRVQARPTLLDPAVPNSPVMERVRSRAGIVGSLWLANGCTPTREAIATFAPQAAVVVLNAWDTAQLRQIRDVNPQAIVLVYKCLASVRSYHGATVDGQDAALLPSGVGYHEARARGWLSRDREGQPIEWTGFPEHWQASVWNRDYRATWVKRVADEVRHAGWDGVFADNQMATLRWYSQQILEGTADRAGTDARVRTGLDLLVDQAGTELSSIQKILIPNLSEGRLDLDRWRASSRYGGVMDEHFISWGGDGGSFVPESGRGGWLDQTAQLAGPLTLVQTTASGSNSGALRFSLGSALVRAEGMVAWAPNREGSPPNTFEDLPQWANLGAASGPAEQLGAAWIRRFERGVVMINPTKSVIVVKMEGRAHLLQPHSASTVPT